MNRRVLVVGGVALAVVLAGSGGSWWWWSAHQVQQADGHEEHSDGGSIALDTSGSQGVQGMNLGGGTNSNGGSEGGGTKGVIDLDGSSGSSGGSNATAPSRDELAGYEKYKDGTNIMYGDIAAGGGAEAKAGSKVTINYRMWLTNGTLADDSYVKGQAFAFTVGEHRVIPGIEAGLMGMKVGGKRRIIVPPAGGYGAKAQGSIPANSVLVFDVELLQLQ